LPVVIVRKKLNETRFAAHLNENSYRLHLFVSHLRWIPVPRYRSQEMRSMLFNVCLLALLLSGVLAAGPV
jgi:hypothetical protein